MQIFKGMQVKVLRQVKGEPDEMGEPTVTWSCETVDNVLVHPGSTTDLEVSRPEGVQIDMTFHFPKTYTASLRGCRIRFNAHEYRVVGDPQPYMEQNTPGSWNRTVGAEAVYG